MPEVKSQTKGTWVAIALNCIIAVLGILQSVDWVHVIGSQSAGVVIAVISAVNMIAHYYSGPDVQALSR